MAVPKPDYLSRDYTGLRESLLQYASQSFPEWQPSSEGDFGILMVELFSYMGDILSYYTDRAQMENYLSTATQRDSVLGLAYLLGYVPNSGAPATGTVTLITDTGMPAVTLAAGTQITTNQITEIDNPVTFETDETVILAADGGANAPVAVTEGTTVRFELLEESTGQPSQAYTLQNTGVYRDTVRVFVEDSTGPVEIQGDAGEVTRAREWVRQEHLLDAESGDAVFEAYEDDSTTIYFGDDINGAIPATGLQIYASYRHGYGAAGNVSEGAVRMLNDSTLSGVQVAQNEAGQYLSSAMIGGADPEAISSIRYNAPRAYRTQRRAITEDDFKNLALGVEGVTKANVVVGSFTSVTVFITGPDGGAPSDTLKRITAAEFGRNVLTGVTVSVADPTFVPVNFGTVASPIRVMVNPRFSIETIRAAVEKNVRALVASRTFGDRLSVGAVYDVMSSIDGVIDVDITVMARADSAQAGVAALSPRPWEIFTVGLIELDITEGAL